MKCFILIGLCAVLTVGAAANENAWLRFDPERPGTAHDPAFTNGWHAIEQFEFSAPEAGEAVAELGFVSPIGPSTQHLMQDVANETLFDLVELVLHADTSQSRLLLERVMVVEQAVVWDGDATASPRQHLTLSFAAITYLYESDDEAVTGTYSEVEIATGGGSAGDYHPRDPTVPPVFGATLSRDMAQPNVFQLSWESDPGVQYDVEFSDDLADPGSWSRIPSGQVFGDEGRMTTIHVTEPLGFYRVRER